MEKENIEKKLYMYSLYSKDTESFAILVMGYDDKESIKCYLDMFDNLYKDLSKYYKGDKLELEKKNLIDKIHDSCIYKVAYFNTFTGEFINDKAMLVDLFDYNIKNKK